uniref:DUF2850 domain-containing protein n=1 Tax=Thaumasiovibrio occultus TaxID=1891184 RepID=UPI00131AFDE0|nr:DUF2850 domain-containing protein [Thaumasiovibrio occultus]
MSPTARSDTQRGAVKRPATKRQLWPVIALLVVLSGALLAIAWLWMGGLPSSMQSSVPVAQVYGVWLEQDVPPYDADRFEVRPDGVFHQGAVVTTQYQFDGQTLTYTLGQEKYRYVLEGEVMTREAPAHYQSEFHRLPSTR